jgi:hypothetical protein
LPGCDDSRPSIRAHARAFAGFWLVGWLIFSMYYRGLCVFRKLGDWQSAIRVFMYGAVVYLIVATLSWIGVAIWKVREADASHTNHHAS